MGGVGEVTVDLNPGGQSAVTVTSDVPLTTAAVKAALDEAGDSYDRLRPTAADSLPALAPEVSCRLDLTCTMMTILGFQA